MNKEARMNLYLIIHSGGSVYALSADEVRSIITPEQYIAVPGAPEHIVGMVDMPGAPVVVASMRKLFGLPLLVDPDGGGEGIDDLLGVKHDIVIVAESSLGRIGLRVDSIEDIEQMQGFVDKPGTLEAVKYIDGYAKREKNGALIGMLSIEKIADNVRKTELHTDIPGSTEGEPEEEKGQV